MRDEIGNSRPCQDLEDGNEIREISGSCSVVWGVGVPIDRD